MCALLYELWAGAGATQKGVWTSVWTHKGVNKCVNTKRCELACEQPCACACACVRVEALTTLLHIIGQVDTVVCATAWDLGGQLSCTKRCKLPRNITILLMTVGPFQWERPSKCNCNCNSNERAHCLLEFWGGGLQHDEDHVFKKHVGSSILHDII